MGLRTRIEILGRQVKQLTRALNKDTVVQQQYNIWHGDTWQPAYKNVDVATIRGEVNAIVDFLGVDIQVRQSENIKKKAKVFTKAKSTLEDTPKRKYVRSGKYAKKAKQ